MVDVTIDGLLDGSQIQTREGLGILQQNAITYKTSTQPNPTRLIHAINQVQLEEELGSNLEIPAGESISISIDESFEITETIKKNAGSSLEIYSPVINTFLKYTGPDQMIDSPGFSGATILENIRLIGNGANRMVSEFSGAIFQAQFVSFEDFGSIASLIVPSVFLINCNFKNVLSGLEFFSVENVAIIRCTLEQTTAENILLFEFLTNLVGEHNIKIETVRALSSFPGDALLNIRQGSIPGSQFVVKECDPGLGQLYSAGPQTNATEIQDAGGGLLQITVLTGFGNFVDTGSKLVFSGFTEPTYNGEFTVVNMINSTNFTIELPFVSNDLTGVINNRSVNNTDPELLASGNKGSDDSMFTGEAGLEIFGSEISSSSLAQDTFEAIDSVNWTFTSTERFVEGISDEGQFICKTVKTRRYSVFYSATIEKSGGGSTDIGIVLLKNVGIVGFNPPHTVNTGKVPISNTNIIELSTDDTLQVAVINYDVSATVIDISQVSLVINLA